MRRRFVFVFVFVMEIGRVVVFVDQFVVAMRVDVLLRRRAVAVVRVVSVVVAMLVPVLERCVPMPMRVTFGDVESDAEHHESGDEARRCGRRLRVKRE